MEKDAILLGRRLSEVRVKAGLTQEELAALAHVRKEHLSRLETGRVQVPRVTTIEAIVTALRDKVSGDLKEELSHICESWRELAYLRRLSRITRRRQDGTEQEAWADLRQFGYASPLEREAIESNRTLQGSPANNSALESRTRLQQMHSSAQRLLSDIMLDENIPIEIRDSRAQMVLSFLAWIRFHYSGNVPIRPQENDDALG